MIEAWNNQEVREALVKHGMSNLAGSQGRLENDYIVHQPRVMFCVKPANDVAKWDTVAMERATP